MRARFRNLGLPRAAATRLADSGRQVARAAQSRRGSEALSWIAWLLAVAAFAVWTQLSYRAPADPAWIGMTVHTAVFAIWTLVLREWLALRLARREKRRPGARREDRELGDD